MTEKTVNKAPSGRPNRKPVGMRNRLTVYDKDPNYNYRWVNAQMDGGSRIPIMEEAGYEKVKKSSVRSETGRIDATALGAYETTPGGNGDTLVLMRTRKEWYEEDQAEKQKRVDELDSAQKRIPEGFYGKISDKL